MVITGDITQIDLPEDKVSGLKVAMQVLEGIDDIAICMLTGADVVRHRLVQKIIEAYEDYEKQHSAASEEKSGNRRITGTGERNSGAGRNRPEETRTERNRKSRRRQYHA